MKLIELLARELVEWHPEALEYAQDKDGTIGASYTHQEYDEDLRRWTCDGAWVIAAPLNGYVRDTSMDHETAIVTRADWEKERAAFLHGQKTNHDFGKFDFVSTTDQKSEGPCDWRDRIHAIDDQLQALTDARSELVKRLADEGFMLCGRTSVEVLPDMKDWRNWQVNDLIEINDVDAESGHEFQSGDVVRIANIDGQDECRFCCYYQDGRDFWWVNEKEAVWHSRP